MKIKIISAYTNDIPYKDMSDITFNTIKNYCIKNGFNYERFDLTNSERKAVFMKIPLIINEFESNDYVIWVDSDAFILNSNFDLISLISSGKKLYISEDFNGINAGVMVWKKCEESKKILQATWDLYDKYVNHIWVEQEALKSLVESNYMDFKKDICYVEQKILNSYDYSLFEWLKWENPTIFFINKDNGNYTSESFVIHFPGISDRLGTIKKYLYLCK